jgi:hypothetical protein
MFDRLKTLFKGKTAAANPAPPARFAPGAPVEETSRSDKDKGKATASVANGKAAVAAAKKPSTPEDLCGITPKMTKEEVRVRLAVLYKRYNRATSSLDNSLRAEAEEMLDAIVAIREKVFGPI